MFFMVANSSRIAAYFANIIPALHVTVTASDPCCAVIEPVKVLSVQEFGPPLLMS